MNADVVERVRMAVAEAGYDPTLIEASDLNGFSFTAPISYPPLVMWRAREVAEVGAPRCFSCAVGAHSSHVAPTCQATLRFEQDCGVDR